MHGYGHHFEICGTDKHASFETLHDFLYQLIHLKLVYTYPIHHKEANNYRQTNVILTDTV